MCAHTPTEDKEEEEKNICSETVKELQLSEKSGKVSCKTFMEN